MSREHDAEMDKFMVDAKRAKVVDEETRAVSPSGKYTLEMSSYETKEGCWNVSRGIVTDPAGKVVADVKRNYHRFWYCWAQHPNGHEYLLCGEDYQGQTVIELDTGKRVDYLPKAAKDGVGFCWSDVSFDPEAVALHVNGCYWACPYEDVTYDFSKPLELPYPEKDRSFSDGSDEEDDDEA